MAKLEFDKMSTAAKIDLVNNLLDMNILSDDDITNLLYDMASFGGRAAAFFNAWDDDDNMKTKKINLNPDGGLDYWEFDKPSTDKKYCLHEWKKYTGLNERFRFCVKCDEKLHE